MAEGPIVKPTKTEFRECWRTIWRTPYVLRLALSAGIGGFLFGYDTGVISGALLYIREDFESVNKKTWLQETIVSMAVAGAIIGAAVGGYTNDKFGRKISILFSDVVFFVGALVMAAAPAPWVIIVGRLLVGLGVGTASVSSPLYISEASPAKIRGALVGSNGLLLTGAQFLSYLINLAFTKARGTWRWMLGIAALPALIQFLLMLSLPESPRWLCRKSRVDEARAVLEKIFPSDEVEKEMDALASSVETEKDGAAAIGNGMFSKVTAALRNTVVRRGLYAGITVQVAQQFVGINTVMYYAPTIVQFAGFASNSVAMALALVTTGLNTFGTLISMAFVDRYGRRKLMMISMIGIITFLVALSVVFIEASVHSPKINSVESGHFGSNSSCPIYLTANDASKWNCMSCLKADCGFCSNAASEVCTCPSKYILTLNSTFLVHLYYNLIYNNHVKFFENYQTIESLILIDLPFFFFQFHPGACLAATKALRSACRAEHRVFYEKGCPSRFGFLAVMFLGLYIISYAPGMGTIPWIVNSEIYPLQYRGIGGGIAAMSNWVANLIVSETYLTLTEHLGAGGTFFLFAGISCIGLAAIFWFVPETKGLTFEEVEKILEDGYRPKLCGKTKKKNVDSV
ncbi:inositol transporter 4 isoform X1 [Jatropha curcas]|uniref:inositol transporter 4 isoform X1 n=1 Tax=Jatropha curcas TaxID=180498 RepID=UPI0018933AC0|nr:inositol transporter 4 isoform X1 [Jatropha curcas]